MTLALERGLLTPLHTVVTVVALLMNRDTMISVLYIA